MASMPINDRRPINPIMLICFSSAKFLLKCVNVVHFQMTTTLLAGLSVGVKTNLLWNSWTLLFEFPKKNLDLGRKRS